MSKTARTPYRRKKDKNETTCVQRETVESNAWALDMLRMISY